MGLRDEYQALLGKRKPVSSRLFIDDGITPFLVVAQLSICAFAWTFAGFMMHKTIPLTDSQAAWIQNHASDTTIIVTLISTILGLIGSYLLCRVVRHALVHRLSYAPLRLHTMVEWTKLAQRSVSLGFDGHRSWTRTLLSIVWVSLLSFLTAAWSGLLTPESVIIYYPVQGNETNFLHPSVSDLFNGQLSMLQFSQPAPGFNLTPYTDPLASLYSGADDDVLIGLTDAGYWAASAPLGSNFSTNPSNFINIYDTFFMSNISTGGIFPPGFFATPPSALWSQILALDYPAYQGLSLTYNATQHGFTANVTCRMPMFNDPTITRNLTNQVIIDANELDSFAIDMNSWSTNCSSQIQYFTKGVTVASDLFSSDGTNANNGLLMASICPSQSFAGSSNQSFLVLFDSPPGSSYSIFAPRVCQVTPLVTTVQATYDQTGLINLIQPPLDQHTLPNPNSTNSTNILLSAPAFMIWSAIVRSQGLASNVIGDCFLHPDLLDLYFDHNEFIENYLRGMTEYIGSLMAGSVSEVSNPNMTVPWHGTLNINTYGWTFHLRTHSTSLAAITLVTVLTVVAGAFSMMSIDWHASAYQKRKGASIQSFDPTETMDMLLASSAGDLAGALVGRDNQPATVSELSVLLGKTDKGKPVLRTVTSMDEGVAVDLDLDRLGPP